MEILFATSNTHKFLEAGKILGTAGHTVKQLHFDYREIRSESLEDVARDAVRAAYRRTKEPVFVEDAGLFIESLNGFPGAYSSWVHRKLGNDGILKLLKGSQERAAYFESCIAYHDVNGISTFHGKCFGTISLEKRGGDGFGYDPIFVPEGQHQTYAESIILKNKLSHRYKTLLEFSKSLKLRR